MLRSAAARARASAPAARGLVTAVLPDLPYDFGALQPVVSDEIMALHHGKHHAAYVANFNVALAQYAEAEAKGDVGRMIALQPSLKFNGGGHVNHSIFWKNLCPPKARARTHTRRASARLAGLALGWPAARLAGSHWRVSPLSPSAPSRAFR
jgi:hypothetical protein